MTSCLVVVQPAQASLPAFATYQECIDYVMDLRRGNHATYCEWNGTAWAAVYDDDYRKGRKKPK